MNKVLISIGFLGYLLLAGCGEKPHYDKTFSFENKTWDQKVMPSFEFEIADTTQVYDFVITLRTTTNYNFNNIWIFLNSTTPSGLKAREPFQIRLADENGSWLGTKSGTVVENQLVFKQRKFPEKGKFKFSIEQGISEQIVDEVLDIGLRVTALK